MSALVKFYKLLNLLSIDVAAGAMVSASFLALFLHHTIELQVLICLGLTVWLIYTIDHLLDAKKIKGKAVSQRHRFHQKHFSALVIAAMLVLLVILILLIEIPGPVLAYGFLFSFLVAVYFFIHQRLYFLKELFGSILYSGGVLLPTMTFKSILTIEFSQWFVLVFFVVTTLINLILFSWFDRKQDEAHQHHSLVSALGGSRTTQLVWILFLGQLGMGLYGCIMMPEWLLFTAVLLMMNVVLFFIFFNWRWFGKHDRYRLAGDAIFFIPLILLLSDL